MDRLAVPDQKYAVRAPQNGSTRREPPRGGPRKDIAASGPTSGRDNGSRIHYEILVWRHRRQNWEIHSCFTSFEEARHVGQDVYRRRLAPVRLVRCEYDAVTGRHRENILMQIPHATRRGVQAPDTGAILNRRPTGRRSANRRRREPAAASLPRAGLPALSWKWILTAGVLVIVVLFVLKSSLAWS